MIGDQLLLYLVAKVQSRGFCAFPSVKANRESNESRLTYPRVRSTAERDFKLFEFWRQTRVFIQFQTHQDIRQSSSNSVSRRPVPYHLFTSRLHSSSTASLSVAPASPTAQPRMPISLSFPSSASISAPPFLPH